MFGLVTQRQLRDELDRAERRYRELEQDWQSWYEKYRTLYARLAKRVKDSEDLENGVRGDGAAASAMAEVAGNITPRAAEIQAQILARRGGSRVPR